MRELPNKLTFGLRRAAASLTSLALGAGLLAVIGFAPLPAQAQTPPEPQKQEPKYPSTTAPTQVPTEVVPLNYQSQQNPFPSGWGNAQNRGWSSDPYWGMLQANVPWGIPASQVGGFPTLFQPLSRVPALGSSPQYLELDGWGFPRGASVFGAFLTRPDVSIDPATYTATPGQPDGTTGFATQPPWEAVENNQPSTITSGAVRYYRAAAATRLNVAAQAVPPAQRFAYDLRSINYNGGVNTQERFQVRISIPSPNGDENATGGPENRVSDARYVVYYYLRATDGTYLAKRKVFTISQVGGGEEVLTNANGNPAYFPFFIRQNPTTFGTTNALPLPVQEGLGIPFQGVIVDNTTGNTGESLYVLAEAINLIPTIDQVAATPTIVKTPSGRRVQTADPTRATETPYAPGTQPFQRPIGPNYLSDQTGTTVGAFVNNAVNERYNNSTDFINDPFDPRYNPASPQYDPLRPYQSWNPSVLFRGPESLIDPRLLPTPPNQPTAYPYPFGLPLPGNPVGPGSNNRPNVPVTDPYTGTPELDGTGQPIVRTASSIDANNHDIYRRNRRAAYQPDPTVVATYNPAVPYYSQAQVIIARTEYVQDPEDGVPDSEKDGTLTLQVGAVFGLDWQTGAPIWRFPDRSYAESLNAQGAYRVNYRNQFLPATPSATLNATDQLSQAARNPLNPNVPLYQVPGIRAVDKNLDGVIADDEVYIVGQGGNGNAGLFASVTFAPRVKVRGNVRLPMYRTVTANGRTFSLLRHADDGEIGGALFANSQTLEPGRYATRDGSFNAVETGVLYVAAANGVVYALDAYGNNDNDYVPFPASQVVNNQADFRTFGTYRPGTTNVLWTFSSINSRQGDTDRNGTINLPRETAAAYNRRLKQEVPGTGSFGQSSPQLAYQRDGGDFTLTTTSTTGTTTYSNPFNWQGEEQRLFVGNGNGVLYAMDSAADAGRSFDQTGVATGVQNLPFRKESYQPVIGYVPPTDPNNPFAGYIRGALGLKWWFQTFSGGINGTPAVSILRQDAGQYQGQALSAMGNQGLDTNRAGRKGVFVTSLEGRVYAVDWSGPVTKIARNLPLSLASGLGDNDGTTGSQRYDEPSVVGRNLLTDAPPAGAFAGYPNAPATLAEALNDGWYFHNVRPATTNGVADQKEGTVRPRWTYPNLYQDINVTDNTRSQVTDLAVDNGLTNPVAGETIAGARLLNGSTTIGQITAPPVLVDFPFKTANGTKYYRSYLAFQAPDFTTDPSPTQSRLYLLDQVGDRANFLSNPRVRGTGNNRRVVSHPRDRWSPGFVLAESAPAWSYRMVYDRLTAAGTTASIEMARRNSPMRTGAQADFFLPTQESQVQPSIDLGGVPGRRVLPTLYIGGIKKVYAIDFDLETGLFMRWRPNNPNGTTAQPASYAQTERFTPMPDLDGLDVNLYTPGAEAAENRLSPLDYSYAQANRQALAFSQVFVRTAEFRGPSAQVTHITITGGPNQNRSAVQPTNGGAAPAEPTVPARPTHDLPFLGLPYLSMVEAVIATATNQITRYDFGDLYNTAVGDAPQRGITRNVNQEINDPLTTSEGYRTSLPQSPNTDPAVRVPNTAYQFPLLLVTDIEGYLHAISSNIEGEDYDSDPNNRHTVGWAVLGFSDGTSEQFAERHVLQFTQQGPGGLSGVAVMSNAYWPATDPSFTNPEREAATPADAYRFYPNGEPNTTSPTPYRVNDVANQRVSPPVAVPPVANNDDPRPAFRPRSLSPGRAEVRDGNGVVTQAAVLPDWHTGQTGFPLDLNGLFFDKRFAGRYGATTITNASANGPNPDLAFPLDPRVTDPITNLPLFEPLQANPQHPNGDYGVRLRLPGYDYIGGLLLTPGTGDATGRRDTQNNLFEELTPGTVNGLLTNPNNQVTNGVRVARGAGGFATGDLSADNDDINPAAQNVAWLYAGGQNGLAYAYTPALEGQSSGGAAGTPIQDPFSARVNGDSPQVAIVSRDFFQNVILPARGSGQLPADFRQRVLAASVARNGGRNLYEWGETVYIVIYDLSARTRDQIRRLPPGQATNLYYVEPNRRITLDFIAENVNTTSGRAVITQERRAGSQDLVYYQDQGSDPDVQQRLGIAVYEYRLNGNPAATLPQTPGANIRVSVTPDPGRQLGRAVGSFPPVTDPTGLGVNADNYFTIANPLAVQGILVETQNGLPLIAADTRIGDKASQNAIGPFAAAESQTTGPKTQLFGQDDGTVASGTEDPDVLGGRYAQAATNGNFVVRRNLSRFIPGQTGVNARPNPRFNNILTDTNRTPEAAYYFPVMASAGYVSHGASGSTNTGPGQQNLRILNRSLLNALGNVRVESVSSGLFRSWPGRVPNAVGDLVEPFSQAQNNNNPRFTPNGMDLFGRINPLPWEALGADVRPWAADSPVNNNPDYPDIIANSRNIRVAGPSGDLTAGNGTLSAQVSTGNDRVNGTVGFNYANNGTQNPRNIAAALTPLLALNATVSVPKYQAANLVATHSLTSTYVAPSGADSRDTTSGETNLVLEGNEGAIQLPRADGTNIPRQLQRLDNGANAITPYGYTMAMRVFAGSPTTTTRGNTSAVVNAQNGVTGISANAANRTTTAFSTGAYRDFEIDFGVPVDMRLEVAGKGTDIIDLGTLGHSFGVDNGLLGYGLTGLYAPGILPPPLVDLTRFTQTTAPYDRFFKAFTVRNEGNVNLYNVRASQRSQVVVADNNGVPTVAGYRWFGLQSQNIDSRFAIGSVGADVLGAINNQLPQVITSLDPRYDLAWDQYYRALPEMGVQVDPNDPAATLYSRYYQGFAGRHTLHKARTGATTGAILSVPDVPSATSLLPAGSEFVITNIIQDPRVAAAVPLGTPSALYTTPEVRAGDDRNRRAILGQSLVLFENHDAGPSNIYSAVPVWIGNGTNPISPAGPLYSGQSFRHPGVAPIAGDDGLSDTYSLWRVRGINGSVPQYQPYTDRGLPLRLVVSESPLTGEVPDRSLPNNNANTGPIIGSGRLPGIDPFPLVDRTQALLRPAQAMAPAAYRSADGSMNVYFTRNVATDQNGTPALDAGFAQPGTSFGLFYSRMQWRADLGTWQPQVPGVPLAGINVNADAYTGGARWFSTPVPIGVNGGSANQANLSPFVLDVKTTVPNNNQTGASLFWINTEPIGQGQTYSRVFTAPLSATGTPDLSNAQPFLDNYDASVQRFSPRAIYAPFGTSNGSQVEAGQTLVFYYGGTGGRYSLYYSIRPAGLAGFPVGTPPNAAADRGENREIQLPIPASLAGASDPMPVYRFLQVPVFNGGGAYTGVRPAWVVDVYYTGLSRTTQVPSIYMSRFEVVRQGGNRFRLQPLSLPRIRSEAVAVSARESVYSARNIDWQRNQGRVPEMPVVRIGPNATTARPIGMTDPEYAQWSTDQFSLDSPAYVAAIRRQQRRWRFDTATGLLYQGYVRGSVNGPQAIVYVDAAAGNVRFRGVGQPRRAENVYVDYQPSAYRITADGQANQGAFAFYDTRPIAQTLLSANQPTQGNILRRTKPMAAQFVGAGRQWLIWQKGANQERGGALVHAVRRVGVDLKAVSTLGARLAQNDSIHLSAVDENGVQQGQPGYTGNQFPLVQQVTLFTIDGNGNRQQVTNGTPTTGIPYEVDAAKGRIYVEPQYEGMYIEVQYLPASGGLNGRPQIADGALTPIDELAETSTQPQEVLIPLRRVVNEIQPYAFLDTFDPTGGQYNPASGVVGGPGVITGRAGRNGEIVPRVIATNPLNGRTEFADPSLQPGRVWLFWSSPRGRQGTAIDQNARDVFPGGYDLFWQTLAPEFDPYIPPLLPPVAQP